MCIAVPGEIINLEGAYASVNIMGVQSTAYIGLIESPKIGDFILIHAGCAIEKVHKDYSSSLECIYKQILEESEG